MQDRDGEKTRAGAASGKAGGCVGNPAAGPQTRERRDSRFRTQTFVRADTLNVWPREQNPGALHTAGR